MQEQQLMCEHSIIDNIDNQNMPAVKRQIQNLNEI